MSNQLITDAQATAGEIPKAWTWVQTDAMAHRNRDTYRTRDGFYYVDWDDSGVLAHGVAKQVRTIVYVPDES